MRRTADQHASMHRQKRSFVDVAGQGVTNYSLLPDWIADGVRRGADYFLDAGETIGWVNSDNPTYIPTINTSQWVDATRFSNQNELTAADICTRALEINIQPAQKETILRAFFVRTLNQCDEVLYSKIRAEKDTLGVVQVESCINKIKKICRERNTCILDESTPLSKVENSSSTSVQQIGSLFGSLKDWSSQSIGKIKKSIRSVQKTLNATVMAMEKIVSAINENPPLMRVGMYLITQKGLEFAAEAFDDTVKAPVSATNVLGALETIQSLVSESPKTQFDKLVAELSNGKGGFLARKLALSTNDLTNSAVTNDNAKALFHIVKQMSNAMKTISFGVENAVWINTVTYTAGVMETMLELYDIFTEHSSVISSKMLSNVVSHTLNGVLQNANAAVSKAISFFTNKVHYSTLGKKLLSIVASAFTGTEAVTPGDILDSIKIAAKNMFGDVLGIPKAIVSTLYAMRYEGPARRLYKLFLYFNFDIDVTSFARQLVIDRYYTDVNYVKTATKYLSNVGRGLRVAGYVNPALQLQAISELILASLGVEGIDTDTLAAFLATKASELVPFDTFMEQLDHNAIASINQEDFIDLPQLIAPGEEYSVPLSSFTSFIYYVVNDKTTSFTITTTNNADNLKAKKTLEDELSKKNSSHQQLNTTEELKTFFNEKNINVTVDVLEGVQAFGEGTKAAHAATTVFMGVLPVLLPFIAFYVLKTIPNVLSSLWTYGKGARHRIDSKPSKNALAKPRNSNGTNPPKTRTSIPTRKKQGTGYQLSDFLKAYIRRFADTNKISIKERTLLGTSPSIFEETWIKRCILGYAAEILQTNDNRKYHIKRNLLTRQNIAIVEERISKLSHTTRKDQVKRLSVVICLLVLHFKGDEKTTRPVQGPTSNFEGVAHSDASPDIDPLDSVQEILASLNWSSDLHDSISFILGKADICNLLGPVTPGTAPGEFIAPAVRTIATSVEKKAGSGAQLVHAGTADIPLHADDGSVPPGIVHRRIVSCREVLKRAWSDDKIAVIDSMPGLFNTMTVATDKGVAAYVFRVAKALREIAGASGVCSAQCIIEFFNDPCTEFEEWVNEKRSDSFSASPFKTLLTAHLAIASVIDKARTKVKLETIKECGPVAAQTSWFQLKSPFQLGVIDPLFEAQHSIFRRWSENKRAQPALSAKGGALKWQKKNAKRDKKRHEARVQHFMEWATANKIALPKGTDEDNYGEWKHREGKSDHDFDEIYRKYTAKIHSEVEEVRDLFSPTAPLKSTPRIAFTEESPVAPEMWPAVFYEFTMSSEAHAQIKANGISDTRHIAMFFEAFCNTFYAMEIVRAWDTERHFLPSRVWKKLTQAESDLDSAKVNFILARVGIIIRGLQDQHSPLRWVPAVYVNKDAFVYAGPTSKNVQQLNVQLQRAHNKHLMPHEGSTFLGTSGRLDLHDPGFATMEYALRTPDQTFPEA